MILEKLEFKWPCRCKNPHNCVVLEKDDPLDPKKIMSFAILNDAFCVCEKIVVNSVFFVRINGIQKALEHGELLFILKK